MIYGKPNKCSRPYPYRDPQDVHPRGARGGPGGDARNLLRLARLGTTARRPHSKWDTYLQLAERTTVHFVLAAYLELLMTFGFKPQLAFFSTEWMSARSSDRSEHELGGENTKGLP